MNVLLIMKVRSTEHITFSVKRIVRRLYSPFALLVSERCGRFRLNSTGNVAASGGGRSRQLMSYDGVQWAAKRLIGWQSKQCYE